MPQRTEQEIIRNWKYMNPPLVSIRCLTYNHEPYIRDAIEGFLMQETDFPFEVIIHDDASTDRTAEIVREYAEQYPQIIKPIFQDENQYSKGVPISATFVWAKMQGKYVASCEGDDYWINAEKLQKQVQFLEENPSFIACYHNCLVVDKKNRTSEFKYPECKANIYTFDHYLNGILPGHTATSVFRNFMKNEMFDLSLVKEIKPPLFGDRILIFLFVSHGKIFCFQQAMSVYRYITDEGGSFSARMNRMGKNERNIILKKHIQLLSQMREYTYKFISNSMAIQTIEMLYVSSLLKFFLKDRTMSTFEDLRIGFLQSKHKLKVILFCCKSIIKFAISKAVALPKLFMRKKTFYE